MSSSNKLIISLFIFLTFVLGFAIGKRHLGSYLLTRELTSENKVAEIKENANLDFNYFSENVIFNNEELGYYKDDSDYLSQITSLEKITGEKVLGVGDERWIEINLSQQRLYGWEGNNLIYNYLISSGKWAPTPTGTFRVWIKVASQTMKGGNKSLGTYYYLPGVKCVMYFYKGYGIHGAYWHNNFGQPMSHGCINMRTNEACELYNWGSVGTRVFIHY